MANIQDVALGYHVRLFPPVLSIVQSRGIQSIFEIGGGEGTFAAKLHEASGASIVSTDVSADAVSRARSHYPHIRFETASAYEDLADRFGRFPCVVALEVVEHLTDPALFVRRVRDLLLPGGIALISTPYHGFWKNLAISLVPGAWDRHWDTLKEPGWHIKFFSEATFRQLLSTELSVDEITRFGRPVPALATGMLAVAQRN